MEPFILQCLLNTCCVVGAGMDIRCSGPAQVLEKKEEGFLHGPENGKDVSVTLELRGKARKTFPEVSAEEAWRSEKPSLPALVGSSVQIRTWAVCSASLGLISLPEK